MSPLKRVAVVVGLVMVVAPGARALAAPAPPTDAQVAQRVDAHLAQMTLEEKVGQLTQIAGGLFPDAKPEETLLKGGAGSVLWLNDTKKFNALQRIAVEESLLKIPVLYGLDVIHGYRTIFPVPLAMAASWDPSVHERAAAVAAKEARSAGIHWTFAPMLDIARDARWGRIVPVTFPLGPDELRYWSTSQETWVQDAEAFDVWVGADSTTTLHAELQVVP